MKLTIELVPKTCWHSNLRTIIDKKDWDTLRKNTYKLANYQCEICNQKEANRTRARHLDCHEIWEYDDDKKIQSLKGLIALCPSCHEVKHIGYANTQNRGHIAIKHLAQINQWDIEKAHKYVKQCFEIWAWRSKFNWELDLSYLDTTLLHRNRLS